MYIHTNGTLDQGLKMKSDSLRTEFLHAMGETYEKYGYPDYCGWIEGLLLLEPREWSQRGIADRLRELFPASKYPTSISSVNRALNIGLIWSHAVHVLSQHSVADCVVAVTLFVCL